MKMSLPILLISVAVVTIGCPARGQVLPPIESSKGITAIEKEWPLSRANDPRGSKAKMWAIDVVRHIYRFQYYPSEARPKHEKGGVTVYFTIDREGRVLTSKILHASGSAVLDQAGLNMVRRASPVPPPPPEIFRPNLSVTAPIYFDYDKSSVFDTNASQSRR